MCNYFSCIVTRDGRLLFTEEDKHETIVQRAQLSDDNLHLAHFARIEVYPGSDPYLDERADQPAWLTDEWALISDRVLALLARVEPHHKAMMQEHTEAEADYQRALRDLQIMLNNRDNASYGLFSEIKDRIWNKWDELVTLGQGTKEMAEWREEQLHIARQEYRDEQAELKDIRETKDREFILARHERQGAAKKVYTEAIRTIEGYVPVPEVQTVRL